MGAMPGEMLAPKGRHGNQRSDAFLIVARYEATFRGVLPDLKTRARGAPCLHHLGIGSRLRTDPLEEIEHQGFYGIRQRALSGDDASSGSLCFCKGRAWYGNRKAIVSIDPPN